jgi:hypothetical protein
MIRNFILCALRLGAHLSSKTALNRNVERPLEHKIRYKKGDSENLSYILSCILGGVQRFCLKQFCWISVRPALVNICRMTSERGMRWTRHVDRMGEMRMLRNLKG